MGWREAGETEETPNPGSIPLVWVIMSERVRGFFFFHFSNEAFLKQKPHVARVRVFLFDVFPQSSMLIYLYF